VGRLNVPQCIVEYRPSSRSRRSCVIAHVPYTSMPAHPDLSAADLDGFDRLLRRDEDVEARPGTRAVTSASADQPAGGERRSQRAHGVLLHLESSALPTFTATSPSIATGNLLTRNPVLAVARGDLRAPEPLLARVHSSCVTSESYGSRDCDCAEQLDAALAHVARAGRGVVFYLMQEGRGAGFTAKARDRMIVQASRNTSRPSRPTSAWASTRSPRL